MLKNEKIELAHALVNPLNEMAAAERVGKILCEIVTPITHADLMALSTEELQELQKAIISAKGAKKAEENGKKYQKHFSETNEKPYKVVC